MQCFLHLFSLQEIIGWEIFITDIFSIPKGLIENLLALCAVIKTIKCPSAVELNNAVAVGDLVMVV